MISYLQQIRQFITSQWMTLTSSACFVCALILFFLAYQNVTGNTQRSVNLTPSKGTSSIFSEKQTTAQITPQTSSNSTGTHSYSTNTSTAAPAKQAGVQHQESESPCNCTATTSQNNQQTTSTPSPNPTPTQNSCAGAPPVPAGGMPPGPPAGISGPCYLNIPVGTTSAPITISTTDGHSVLWQGAGDPGERPPVHILNTTVGIQKTPTFTFKIVVDSDAVVGRTYWMFIAIDSNPNYALPVTVTN